MINKLYVDEDEAVTTDLQLIRDDRRGQFVGNLDSDRQRDQGVSPKATYSQRGPSNHTSFLAYNQANNNL